MFSKKDEIADSVDQFLVDKVKGFGFTIQGVLLVEIVLPSEVMAAMNEIQAKTRLAIAAQQQGEADKIILVKKAEAEKASKILQGEGIAGQRAAIVDGLKKSIDEMKQSVKDISESQVLSTIMLTQYFDVLKDIGMGSNSKILMLNSSPKGLEDLGSQIRDAVIVANESK